MPVSLRAWAPLCAALFSAGSTAVAAPLGLAPHRAVYDVSLVEADQGTDVTGVTGRLVIEFTGSECAGYSSKLRFVTEMEDPEGGLLTTDARSTTFETADGTSLAFANQTYAGDILAEESEGKASRTGSKVAVRLTRPDEKEFVLDDKVVFPTEQIERIIATARRGDAFLSFDVYDGSEGGETVYDTAGVIGRVSTAPNDVGEETAVKDAGIAGIRHWPVTISYFDQRGGGEETPFYTLSFVIYENGIGRTMTIDYGDFTLAAKLTGLELLPAPPCP